MEPVSPKDDPELHVCSHIRINNYKEVFGETTDQRVHYLSRVYNQFVYLFMSKKKEENTCVMTSRVPYIHVI